MSVLNLNKVLLCGRLTADTELKKTQSGRSVVSFTLAVNRPRTKDTKDGEKTADFLTCVAWDGTAEFISRYFGKGDSLFVSAKVRTRNYKDRDGRTVYVTEFYIDEAQFVDAKSRAGEAPQIEVPNIYDNDDGGDDLPF